MPTKEKSRLIRKIPIFTWLPSYERASLRTDIMAGLAVWAMTVPQALAYAGIAGVHRSMPSMRCALLWQPTRVLSGCISCRLYQELEKSNIPTLIEEWESRGLSINRCVRITIARSCCHGPCERATGDKVLLHRLDSGDGADRGDPGLEQRRRKR